MIRPTTPDDTPALLAISEGTGVFSPSDIIGLREVLDEYHDAAAEVGHHCLTYEQDGEIIGFAYWAPAPLTDRTWDLWWIVVSQQTQSRGVGGKMLRHVEAAAKDENGRMLVLETSSLPSYEATRRFYVKNGYDKAAVVKDYYADGHDLVIYSKRLDQ